MSLESGTRVGFKRKGSGINCFFGSDPLVILGGFSLFKFWVVPVLAVLQKRPTKTAGMLIANSSLIGGLIRKWDIGNGIHQRCRSEDQK